jgi:hypothetical protein
MAGDRDRFRQSSRRARLAGLKSGVVALGRLSRRYLGSGVLDSCTKRCELREDLARLLVVDAEDDAAGRGRDRDVGRLAAVVLRKPDSEQTRRRESGRARPRFDLVLIVNVDAVDLNPKVEGSIPSRPIDQSVYQSQTITLGRWQPEGCADRGSTSDQVRSLGILGLRNVP